MTEIETGLQPEEKVAKRARKKKEAKPNVAADLLKALQFVMPAQREEGLVYQTHCLATHHWLLAYDELLTIGCKIVEDIAERIGRERIAKNFGFSCGRLCRFVRQGRCQFEMHVLARC